MSIAAFFSVSESRTSRRSPAGVERRARARRARRAVPHGDPPRLRQILPSRAAPGEPVWIEGDGLEGDDIYVDFGDVRTWGMPLDDRTILCVVPVGASAAGVTVTRSGLRSNTLAFGGPWGDDPTRVVRVDPRDGVTGVFRDTPVLLRLSRPVERESLCDATVRVEDADGLVPGHLQLSPDDEVIIWRPARFLEGGVEHAVVVAGLRDRRGRDVTPHRSRFVPCTLRRVDLA